MLIGIPKEIKDHENRVGATPAMVKVLCSLGHKVRVQAQAGAQIGFADALYQEAGALIVSTPQKVYEAEMVIKVKEPQSSEFPLLKEGQILFCYLHLAPDPEQTKALLKSGVVAIAYETVTDRLGRLPLLIPMSEIAGRLSIQVGASYLQMANGGRGVLLGGVPGVAPGKVAVIGGGVVGTHAARMAMGLGADVSILDNNLSRIRELDELFGHRIKALYSTPASIEEAVAEADLVVGGVLIAGQKAPRLVKRSMVQKMKKGAVMVDVAIDQGGCFETSKPTTHSDPVYEVDGVIHYCVTNMPGAVARTSTLALTNATLPYAIALAEKGYELACTEDLGLAQGLNVCLGRLTNPDVWGALGEELGIEYCPPEEAFCCEPVEGGCGSGGCGCRH